MKLGVIFLAAVLSVCSYSQELKIGYIGDLELIEGGKINDCKITYLTAGMLNDDSSNVIIYPTWFGGRSQGTFNTGVRLFDTTKYFLIAVDALGNGSSSSPSNTPDQMHEKFPCVTIKDMVNSQYHLLTKVLGLRHIHAVIGGSMGAMQAFQWAVSYPDYMDKVITYVGTPQLTTFDLMLWKSQIAAIESWERNGGSKDDLADVIITIHSLLATTPDHKNRQVNRDNFETYINQMYSDFRKTFSPYNWKLHLIAMSKHDISVNGSLDEAASLIKSDLMIMVGLRDLIVNPAPALEFAEKYNFKKYVFDNDCGHLAPGCEFDRFKEVINGFLEEKPLN
jgi:homoserine O-acetyltransferase/O-succinyltransferase